MINEEILESSVVTSRTSLNTGGDVNKFRSGAGFEKLSI